MAMNGPTKAPLIRSFTGGAARSNASANATPAFLNASQTPNATKAQETMRKTYESLDYMKKQGVTVDPNASSRQVINDAKEHQRQQAMKLQQTVGIPFEKENDNKFRR